VDDAHAAREHLTPRLSIYRGVKPHREMLVNVAPLPG
jgi:hypothetical protein